MSDETSSGTADKGWDAANAPPPKKGVSPARNIIGLVVLLAVVVVGWFEYSAVLGYNAAVKALNARSQDETQGLMTMQEAESLFGKAPDGPGTDVQDGSQSLTQKTYTWRGVLKSHTLTAFYTKQNDGPRLLRFETEGAKFTKVPAPPGFTIPDSPPPGQVAKGSRTGKVSKRAAAPDAKKSKPPAATPDAKESKPPAATPPANTPDAKESKPPAAAAPDAAKAPK